MKYAVIAILITFFSFASAEELKFATKAEECLDAIQLQQNNPNAWPQNCHVYRPADANMIELSRDGQIMSCSLPQSFSFVMMEPECEEFYADVVEVDDGMAQWLKNLMVIVWKLLK